MGGTRLMEMLQYQLIRSNRTIKYIGKQDVELKELDMLVPKLAYNWGSYIFFKKEKDATKFLKAIQHIYNDKEYVYKKDQRYVINMTGQKYCYMSPFLGKVCGGTWEHPFLPIRVKDNGIVPNGQNLSIYIDNMALAYDLLRCLHDLGFKCESMLEDDNEGLFTYNFQPKEKKVTVTCQGCKKEFKAVQKRAMYCSEACKSKAKRS